MGWKGALRSLNASAKKSQNEREKTQRSLQRSINKIEKNVNDIIRKSHTFETQLKRDIIKALNIKYIENIGLTSIPFEIHTEIFKLKINLTNPVCEFNETQFVPLYYQNESVTIKPLDISITQWGTIVAFKVENNDEYFRMRLNWLKKTDPASSSVYLIDTINSQYYQPIATDLKGEVVFNNPRTGIIVFEPFLKPTESIQIHFSNVKLSTKRSVYDSFNFSYNYQNLHSSINQQISKPDFVQQVRTVLDEQEKKAKENAVKSHQGSYIILIIFIIIAIYVFSNSSDDDKRKIDLAKKVLPTAEYQYAVETGKSGITSYNFNENEKPKLDLCGNNICNVSSVNAVLKFLNLPTISKGVAELSSITGYRTDRGLYHWENYPLGTLTIRRTLCGGSKRYDCISGITIKKELNNSPLETETFKEAENKKNDLPDNILKSDT